MKACRTILNIANAREEDGATYMQLLPLYEEALELATKASNPRLKANALNSLAVLQEANGYPEISSTIQNTCLLNSSAYYLNKFLDLLSEENMEKVNQLCSEYGIDLDDDSESSPSQNHRNDSSDEEIDLDELIGTPLTESFNFNAIIKTFLARLYRRRQRRRRRDR